MKKKVLLKGPLLTRSGYGEQARFALRSLRSREDLFDIYIQPIQWGKTSWISLQDDERLWIDETIEKTIGFFQSGGQFDIALQVTIPNEWERIQNAKNVGYTAGIETTAVAPIWIQKGIEQVDNIIVVSDHAKESYVSTTVSATNSQTGEQIHDYRLTTPIESVNYPVKTYETLPELDLQLATDFNFLVVAQFGPRKNLPNTLKWFVEEFAEEEIGLVIKTNLAKNCLMDREKVASDLKEFMKSMPEHKCKVYLLHGDMTDEEMHSLYKHEKISAFVALPHGEGFGLPIFEAAYSGLPVVSVVWSGQRDFLYIDKEHKCYDVAFDIQPVQPEVVWENVLIKESAWAYAREQSAKEKMRQCYEDIRDNVEDSIASNAAEYASLLHDRFSADKMYAQFVENIYPVQEMKEMESELDDLLADLL